MSSPYLTSSRRWTTDEIIGYLHSTSSSSVPVLGEKKEPLKEMYGPLGIVEPGGVFQEQVTTTILAGGRYRLALRAVRHARALSEKMLEGSPFATGGVSCGRASKANERSVRGKED